MVKRPAAAGGGGGGGRSETAVFFFMTKERPKRAREDTMMHACTILYCNILLPPAKKAVSGQLFQQETRNYCLMAYLRNVCLARSSSLLRTRGCLRCFSSTIYDVVKENAFTSIEIAQIRNFSVIAHVDHGKSTLSDCLLQWTGNISELDRRKGQVLDTLQVERERGITVKAQTASMIFIDDRTNIKYLLNLIDTPGHIDFTYEGCDNMLNVCALVVNAINYFCLLLPIHPYISFTIVVVMPRRALASGCHAVDSSSDASKPWYRHKAGFIYNSCGYEDRPTECHARGSGAKPCCYFSFRS